ncbi:MAG: FMN-binding protein [Bacilli bacterium]|jgi:electron transport complex protein RnfG|nr:FMN-binding protein [Bacilli bacterium]
MKKSIKLPLFLGLTCLGCTGVLAVVNELTSPIIKENEVKAQNAGYLQLFELNSFDGYKLANPEISADLQDEGIVSKLEITNASDDTLFGIAYDASVTGYSSDGIKFQVGFKDGKYAGFVVITSGETPGFGQDYLNVLTTYLKGLDANTTLEKLEADTIGLKSGTTHTREGVLPAVFAAAQDYLADAE